ncbi:MAG: type II toxin-antitoxin system RelE/ParE family toxin [Desulfotomaculaceae bacterium]|nr:type II toxin-antitoxin system RelE/ParE family toxin [Desulfotomaculaceae bacterium]
MTKKRFFLTKQATLDIQEITEYIARDSIENAIKFADELLEVCRSIPEVGHPEIREIIHKNYRLVYTLRKEKIFILQVFNAAKLFRMQNIELE